MLQTRVGLPTAVAALALATLLVSLVYLAGKPLSTDDFWWHLKMGEIYSTQGLDLSSDPISHTAERAPEPHQWLFGVAVYAAERAVGLHGLRAIHVLAVCAIVALAFSIFQRAAGSALLACLATAGFIAIAWWRLFQFRPDLVSIAITLGVYRLLLELRSTPSWWRVVAAVALMVIWANAHTLFAIGPALIVAALLGFALFELLRRWAQTSAADRIEITCEDSTAARLAVALGLILIATLLNPRGIDQHLTFFESAGSSALWIVRDEWTHFDLFDPTGYGFAMSGLSFAAVDVSVTLFVVASAIGLWRFAKRPNGVALRRFDPVGFGLGLAGIVALLVAVRFTWLVVFAIVYSLRMWRANVARPSALVAWSVALLTVAITIGFHVAPNYQAASLTLPRDWSSYFSNPFDRDKYYGEGVDFLRETGLEGRLFNSYAMGGFAAYWLSPALQTFVDGRMNFGEDVLRDYKTVTLQRTSPNESFVDVLERRRVDVFFGVGVPTGPRGSETTLYTTANLERNRNWLLVSRSMRHAIYLRDVPRNRSNLERVANYYAAQGVPFDAHDGVNVSRVIAERPDWASRHNMLPARFEQLLTASRSQQPAMRVAGLEGLALAHALAGAYREQLEYDRAAEELRPRAKAPLRRSVYGLLRLDRANQAVATAKRLLALDPADPRSQIFANIAGRYLESSRAMLREGRRRGIRDAEINVLPLVAD